MKAVGEDETMLELLGHALVVHVLGQMLAMCTGKGKVACMRACIGGVVK